MEFHHIGIACYDIEASVKGYSLLGYIKKYNIYDPIQKVDLCFLEKKNAPLIELVSSNSPDSPIFDIIKKNGTAPYHTCYEVDDLDFTIKELRKNRFLIVLKPTQAIAFDNKNIAFLFNKSVGLIELLQK